MKIERKTPPQKKKNVATDLLLPAIMIKNFASAKDTLETNKHPQ